MLDAAVDAIIVIDHLGTIQEFSQAAQRVFGYVPEEIIGCNVRDLMPEPWRSEHDGYLQRYHETRSPHIIGVGREVRAQRKDGSILQLGGADKAELEPGEVFVIETPGGGGYGTPVA